MKQSLLFAARLLGLVISYFLAFAIISATLLPRLEQSQSEAGTALVALLAISIINTCALTYVTLRSRWNGLKLILALWFALFGVLTLMSQIETAVFIRTLPQGFLPRIFLVGFLFSGVFAFLLTLVLGKRKRSEESHSTSNRLQMPISSWVYKLAIIAVVYVIIYFTFGYFFAWSSPAVREYYGGGEYNGLLRQFIHVWQQSPWLFPLQVFRALLWTAIAIPVIKMTKGAWWEAGLAVALLFSVVMNTQLLLPNPLMPYEVRMAHLVETASSNFLFAWILVWLLIMKSQITERNARLKRGIFLATLSLFIFGVCETTFAQETQSTASKWKLVWQDEFDGRDGSPIDPKKWTAEVGGKGWGNRELQTYTDRIENAYQANGSLVIKASKEQYTGVDKITREYTSARLITKKTFTTTYGRFVARIKVPRGQGIWPAFWMLGDDIDKVGWPKCGEIDIMEYIGKEPTNVYATIHGPGYSGKNGLSTSYSLPGKNNFADDFHTYAVEWEPNVMRFYCDDVLYKTVKPSDLPPGTKWVFDHSYFILLNVAVGGNWPGSPDDTTVFPQLMMVDYVRVYQAHPIS